MSAHQINAIYNDTQSQCEEYQMDQTTEELMHLITDEDITQYCQIIHTETVTHTVAAENKSKERQVVLTASALAAVIGRHYPERVLEATLKAWSCLDEESYQRALVRHQIKEVDIQKIITQLHLDEQVHMAIMATDNRAVEALQKLKELPQLAKQPIETVKEILGVVKKVCHSLLLWIIKSEQSILK